MARPPLAQPLFFFSLLLVLGGAGGALGSFWWSARWHGHDEATAPALPLRKSITWDNRPGWLWLIEPTDWDPWKTATMDGGILGFSQGPEGIDVFLSCAEQLQDGQAPPRFDAVAVDEAGKRIKSVEAIGTGMTGGVALVHWRFRPQDVPADSVSRIGVEVLVPPAGRKGR